MTENTQLMIRLSGSIVESNFQAFKDQFIIEIKAANKELKTDEDFAEAAERVKAFKGAEKMLQEAKKAALDDTVDIRQLFAAIDELDLELKTTRLALDKQIIAEKEKRKKEVVDKGIESARAAIKDFVKETPAIGFLYNLDASRFDAAVKGKRSVESMESAVEETALLIVYELEELREAVRQNTEIIAEAGEDYSALFQDRKNLLAMGENELRSTIEARIANYKLEEKRKADIAAEKKKNEELKAAQIANAPDRVESLGNNVNLRRDPDDEIATPGPVDPSAFNDLAPEPVTMPVVDQNSQDGDADEIESFQMVVIIQTHKERAIQIANEIGELVHTIPEVKTVNLERCVFAEV